MNAFIYGKGQSMPKLLENVRQDLLEEARKQINEIGYEKITMRNIASGCGIAVGTIYHYFSSKDMLIASLMLEDWLIIMDQMRSDCAGAENVLQAAKIIYEGIRSYTNSFLPIFTDRSASKAAGQVYHQRHLMLRDQLSSLLQPFSLMEDGTPDEYLAAFTAEALLAWTVEDKPFSEIARILERLY